MVLDSEDGQQAISLADLYRRSCRVASALQLPNSVEGVLISQAAMMLGLVIAPIVHTFGPREVGYILQNSGARASFIRRRTRRVITQFIKNGVRLCKLIPT